jgi:hypothetical protein
MNRLVMLFVLHILLWGVPAFAQCANPAADEGEIIYNTDYNVHQYCNGSAWIAFGALNPGAGGSGCGVPTGIAGDLMYNSAYHVLQYCDGDDWRAVGGGMVGLSGPSGCTNIGDLCADGTVFAGYHPITQEHLFIPTTDQGTTSAWKTSTGVNDIATDSTYDGRANTNQVANSTTFPAFKLCKDLTTGGHSDWYLPAQVEAYYLWSVRGTIEAGGNITNFQNAIYWSSTENGTTNAWNQFFTDGLQNGSNKANAMWVRCVRR